MLYTPNPKGLYAEVNLLSLPILILDGDIPADNSLSIDSLKAVKLGMKPCEANFLVIGLGKPGSPAL